MKINPCLLALAAASLCGPVSAATTATLTINGSVTPSSCSVSLTGATVDYGAMARATVQAYSLRESVAYTLPSKTVSLSVTCNNPIPIALNVADNKADSRASIGATSNTIPYGLGLAGTAKVGAYALEYSEVLYSTRTADTPRLATSHFSRAVASTGNWSYQPSPPKFAPDEYVGFILNLADNSPTAVRAVTAKISVKPYLLKTTVDNAPGEIKLDGSATVTLQYV